MSEDRQSDLIEWFGDLPDEVIPKAWQDLPTDLEKMLRAWYLENGSGEGGAGCFGITP
jgi:hypothetical protein